MSNGKEEHYTDSKFKWWDGGGDRKCLKKKKRCNGDFKGSYEV